MKLSRHFFFLLTVILFLNNQLRHIALQCLNKTSMVFSNLILHCTFLLIIHLFLLISNHFQSSILKTLMRSLLQMQIHRFFPNLHRFQYPNSLSTRKLGTNLKSKKRKGHCKYLEETSCVTFNR